MSWVFEHSKSTLADRLVLLAIADHANHEGCDAWPSIPWIAEKARVSRATVHRSINELVKLGELEVQSGRGRGHRNTYKVVIDKTSQSATLTAEKVSSTHVKGLIHADRASLFKPSLTAPGGPPLSPEASQEAARTAKEVLAKAKSNTPLGSQPRKVS